MVRRIRERYSLIPTFCLSKVASLGWTYTLFFVVLGVKLTLQKLKDMKVTWSANKPKLKACRAA